MNLDRLFADGQELVVEKRIGKGGEGEVYSLSNVPGYAIKAYLPALVHEREAKIRAMVGTGLAKSAPMVAFPYQVVTDARGRFVGFMMKLVAQHKEIHELQTPSSRQTHFPKAGYPFLVRVALNIARVFTQVHTTGCVVGDINQRGILVSPTATVALIDADSFQIVHNGKRYLCVVGVPEYTPPELQGQSLRSIVRTVDHDSFGLAVCLFQVLCMDRHPFSGRFTGAGDMPLEKAIAEFRFAYSSRNTGMIPPPGTVRLPDLTPAIARLFEQAFSPQHVGRRPSAGDWVVALTELEGALRACANNKLHHYPKNASECPWCRMEATHGRPLFIDTDFSGELPTGQMDPAGGLVLDLAALMAAINGIVVPTTISVALPQAATPRPSQAALDAKRKKATVPAVRVGGAAFTALAAFLLFSGIPFLIAALPGIVGLFLIFRGYGDDAVFLKRFTDSSAKVSERITTLQDGSPVTRVVQKKAQALAAIEGYKSLKSAFGSVLPNYEKTRRQKQLETFLSAHPIRTAHIPKLTSADIASLASYGFTSALDAKLHDVQQAFGIGPVKSGNIGKWVSRVEAKFQFQPAHTQDDRNAIVRAQLEVVTKQRDSDKQIKALIAELRAEAREFERWRNARDPELARLRAEQVQCEVDLRHLKIPVPPVALPQPLRVPPVAVTSSWPTPRPVVAPTSGPSRAPAPSPSGRPSCPSCGRMMVRRTARRGANAGRDFWGCTNYPTCTGTRPI